MGCAMLIDSLTGHDATTLPAIVRLNLCLTAVNAIIFFLIGRYVLGSWWASSAFALLYAGNLNTVHAALSEGPAAFGATHFWFGTVAGGVIDDARAPRRLRVCALLLLAAVVGLATLVRGEWCLVGGPALILAGARIFGWEAEVRRAAADGGRLLRSVVSGPLSVFVLASLVLCAVQWLPWMGHLSYVLAVVVEAPGIVAARDDPPHMAAGGVARIVRAAARAHWDRDSGTALEPKPADRSSLSARSHGTLSRLRLSDQDGRGRARGRRPVGISLDAVRPSAAVTP